MAGLPDQIIQAVAALEKSHADNIAALKRIYELKHEAIAEAHGNALAAERAKAAAPSREG